MKTFFALYHSGEEGGILCTSSTSAGVTGLSLHSGLLLKTLTILPHMYDRDGDEDDDDDDDDDEREPQEIFTNNVILGQAHSLRCSK